MIGIDVVKIERIESLYNKFGSRGLKRFLSDDEIGLCNSKISSLAGLWASKEAISKALGCGIGSKLSFLDMQIYKNKKGKPKVKFKKKIIKRFKIKKAFLSITHDGGVAIAVAVILTTTNKI